MSVIRGVLSWFRPRCVARAQRRHGTRTARRGSRSWLVLLHLLLELAELPVGCGLARGAVELRLEQLVRRVHAGTRPPGRLEVAPRALGRALRLAERSIALGAD